MSHSPRRADPRAAKARDMSRSVLPSTRRAGSRAALTSVRRRHRHHMTAYLREVAKRACTCGVGTEECARCDSEPEVEVTYPLREHLWAIADRRSCDKLAPLLRWGRSHMAADGQDDGPVRLRAALPEGPIGAHALRHLEIAGVVTGPNPQWFGHAPFSVDPHKVWFDRRRAGLTSAGTAMVDAGQIAHLHAVLKRHPVANPERRWGRPSGVGVTPPGTAAPPGVGPFGFRQLPPPVGDGATQVRPRWWRPLAGRHDLVAWIDAYCVCADYVTLDAILKELEAALGE